jgi:trimethylamine:corrinoid methyltransferase-like protein
MISQRARPEAPFYYCASSSSANMRTLDPIVANPHALRVIRFSVELGRSYGLPVISLATTDSKSPDPQAALEIAATFQAAMQAGAHLIQGPTSMMDQMMLSSFVQAVIDNDIIGYLLAARREVEVSDANLALGPIDEVINDPSLADFKFAMHPHTAQHFREELWGPWVLRYDPFTLWQAGGASSLVDAAAAVVRHIWSHHHPEPLLPELANRIRTSATA